MKIGWFLLGNENVGSSRIQGINIHNYFNKIGIKSIILQKNSIMKPCLTITMWQQLIILLSKYDVLIFQKIFDSKAMRFALLARKFGIKTIFLQSDLIETKMVKKVDAIVVSSEYLKRYYDNKYGIKTFLIEDAIEVNKNLFKKDYECKEKITLIWVGHKDNWKTLDIIYQALEKINDNSFCLKTISNHPDADIKWKLETVFQEILKGDIGVIPCLSDEWSKAKSNNRLTMFMALGLPVIASAIPSYQKIINHGKNGFIAKNIDDWIKSLLILKDNKNREKIGLKGREDALNNFDIEIIGWKWVSFIKELCNKK